MRHLTCLLTYHPALTLLLLIVFAAIFGLSSYNLVMALHTNIVLVQDYGWDALKEGAFEEFVELFGYSLVSAVFYILFKACEKILVDRVVK